MNLFKLVRISDVFTFLNAVSGLLAIFFAVIGKITNNTLMFNVAPILLLAAVFFDYFDGKTAKMKKIGSEFGKQLDSLADLISFGVAPSVFVFLMFTNMTFLFVYIIFLISGMTRLARFNVTRKLNYFEGMPITLNGIIFPLLYFLKVSSVIYYAAFVLSAVLMISRIKVKKLS